MPRRFQIRLRTIFLLMALVAVLCLVGPPVSTKVHDWLFPEPVSTPVYIYLGETQFFELPGPLDTQQRVRTEALESRGFDGLTPTK